MPNAAYKTVVFTFTRDDTRGEGRHMPNAAYKTVVFTFTRDDTRGEGDTCLTSLI